MYTIAAQRATKLHRTYTHLICIMLSAMLTGSKAIPYK